MKLIELTERYPDYSNYIISELTNRKNLNKINETLTTIILCTSVLIKYRKNIN